jgi:hypothetical protein
MSFVTWDYKCHNCGKVEELTVRRSEQDTAGPATTFRFAGGYIAPKRSK